MFMKDWMHGNKRYVAFLLLFGVFRTAIADWNPVPTASMRPTILEGDVVLVDRLAYDLKVPLTDIVLARLGDPRRGDIVTFSSPADGMRLIKRVVGVPGDVVEMRDNHLIVNGEQAHYAGIERESPAHVGQHGIAALRETESIAGSERIVQWLPGLPSRSSFGPLTVPQDQYLMLGDNRDNSEDSRYIGFVPRERLIARATRVLVSADIKDRWQPRLGRTGSALR
ncbi:signal peptidase I [Dokdonella sp.]|uniref:signal peptidase I n=1 Tax=Dokdonella sp. TaxID=2291710 RepID=UPI003784BE41